MKVDHKRTLTVKCILKSGTLEATTPRADHSKTLTMSCILKNCTLRKICLGYMVSRALYENQNIN